MTDIPSDVVDSGDQAVLIDERGLHLFDLDGLPWEPPRPRPGNEPATPEEAYCLTRQVAVFESLAGSRRPPLAEIRASSRQGRQHLVSVVSHLLSTGQL